MLRRLEPDQVPFNVILQQIKKTPELMGQIIKQSTNILAQNVEKRYDEQRHEMIVNINEVFEREVSKIRQQNLNNIFDTWNYLSEIKFSLKDILTSLTMQTSQPSENLKTKVDNCQELVLQLQQKMKKKSLPPKQKLKSIQYLLPTEGNSELEVKSQSDSVDEFHTILYSETDMSDSMNDFETTSFDEKKVAKINSKEEFSINHQFLDETFDEQCEIILKAREKSPRKIEKMNNLQNYLSIRIDNSKEELLEHSINQSNRLENTFDHEKDQTNLKSLQKSSPKIEQITRNQNNQSVRGVDSKTELSDESGSKDEFNTPMSKFETSLNDSQTFQSLSFSNKIEFEPILEKSLNVNVEILQNYQSKKSANSAHEVIMSELDECRNEINCDEDEFQGSFRRRKAIEKTRNLVRSKSTLLRNINFPGIKRKLLDEEKMFEILIEKRQDLSQMEFAVRTSSNDIPPREPCLPSSAKRKPVKAGYETPDYSCNQTFLSTISTVY